MVSATKSSNFEKWPTESIVISAMTSSEKSKLRKKLKFQLHQVRSAIKDIDNYYIPKKTMTSPTSVLQSSPSSVLLQSSPGKALSVAIKKVHLHFREKDRAAARIALQHMKKTVHIYEDAETLKEIERVRHLQIFGPHHNPLELFGLYLKKDYMDEEEEEGELRYMNCEDLEEGLLALLISQAASNSYSVHVAATGLLVLLQLGSISPLLMLLLHLLLQQMPFFSMLLELVGMLEIKAKSEGECINDRCISIDDWRVLQCI